MNARDIGAIWAEVRAAIDPSAIGPMVEINGVHFFTDRWTGQPIPHDIAAAIFRDTAIRWILEQGRGAPVDRACLMLSRIGKTFNADAGRVHTDDWKCMDHMDLDHALAAAVKCRLDARVPA